MTLLNPYVILGIIGALLASFVAGGLVGWHEKGLRVPALLEAQQTVDQKSCADAQKLTKDANDALQKDRDSIAAKLASLKLQHPKTIVYVASKTDLPSAGAEHAGQNGAAVNSDALRNYAAEAEQYRSSFIVCNGVLDAERRPDQTLTPQEK